MMDNLYNRADPDDVDPNKAIAEIVHLPTGSPRSLTRKGTARDHEALRLKATGHSPQEIAEMLNLGDDERRVNAAIKRALGSMLRFATDEHRALELESYDELEVALWRQLRRSHLLVDRGVIVIGLDGDPLTDDRFVLETIDRIMKIKDRRAKLLGLDAPARAEILNLDSIDAEISRLQNELLVDAPVDEIPEIES